MRTDDRTKVDDVPAVCSESLDGFLHGENRAENIDVVMKVKALFCNLSNSPEPKHSSVVDQNIQSSECGIDFFEQAFYIAGLGYVTLDRNRFASAVNDRLSHTFTAFLIGRIVHGDLCARRSQRCGNSGAYAF